MNSNRMTFAILSITHLNPHTHTLKGRPTADKEMKGNSIFNLTSKFEGLSKNGDTNAMMTITSQIPFLWHTRTRNKNERKSIKLTPHPAEKKKHFEFRSQFRKIFFDFLPC